MKIQERDFAHFWRMENPPALSEPNLLLQGTFEIQVRFLAR